MSLQQRIASCDICGHEQQELRVGTGWPGWAIVQGVGAREPKKDTPLDSINTETYLCPECTDILSRFMTSMQENYK